MSNYIQHYTSFSGADLVCAFDNQVVGEVQSYCYKEQEETPTQQRPSLLTVEIILFSSTIPILKSLKEKRIRSFTAKYCNEYGDKIIYEFPKIIYKSYKIKTSIDDVVTSILLEYEVLKEPDILSMFTTSKPEEITALKETSLINKPLYNTEYDYRLTVYVPKVCHSQDLIKENIDDYIIPENIYKIAYYNNMDDLKDIYTQCRLYEDYPCTIKKNGIVLFKGFVYELLDFGKENKQKSNEDKVCDMRISASFKLNRTLFNLDMPKEKYEEIIENVEDMTNIYLDNVVFDMGNNKKVRFTFQQRWSRIKQNDTDIDVLICGDNIHCYNLCDIENHTAKYLANVYKIEDMTFHSDEYKKLCSFVINDIAFIDSNKTKFKVHKKVIDDFNNKINKELTLNDTSFEEE